MRILGWLAWGASAWAQTLEVEPTFNAGAKLRCGERTVLIDSLFREHPAYQSPNEREREAMTGLGGAVLALATHAHRDHWDGAVVARLLERNPRARFWGTRQTAGELAGRFPGQVKVMEREGSGVWEGVEVRFAPLPHSGAMNREIENSAIALTICGQRVLHPGDAETKPEAFGRFGRVDVALAPYWYLLGGEGDEVVRGKLRAKEVWALHGDPRDRAWVGKVRERYPAAKIPAYFERR